MAIEPFVRPYEDRDEEAAIHIVSQAGVDDARPSAQCCSFEPQPQTLFAERPTRGSSNMLSTSGVGRTLPWFRTPAS